MDNQLLNTPFPVMISCREEALPDTYHQSTYLWAHFCLDFRSTSQTAQERKPFLGARVVRQVPTHHTDFLIFVRELRVHMAELDVRLEEDFLTKFSDFVMPLFPSAPHAFDPHAYVTNTTIHIYENRTNILNIRDDTIPTPLSEGGDSDLIIYFEHLSLPPLEGTLSFTNSSLQKINSVYLS